MRILRKSLPPPPQKKKKKNYMFLKLRHDMKHILEFFARYS